MNEERKQLRNRIVCLGEGEEQKSVWIQVCEMPVFRPGEANAFVNTGRLLMSNRASISELAI